jgi:hypothetical protein
MVKRVVLACVVAGGLAVGTASVASADQPGPGDKQCIPGQQGNPKPGHKAGVCSNP